MTAIELPINAIHRCAADPAFVADVERLYDELDRRISARNPVCINRGDCCHFDRFGHRLYVTSAELAYLLARASGPVRPVGSNQPCPYQVENRCTVRVQRPSGCRIFFCDSAAQDWQGPETEATLRRLREIHDRYDLPYAYVEWTAALRALASAPPRTGALAPPAQQSQV
jgi:Fe-S-cluster containining protein